MSLWFLLHRANFQLERSVLDASQPRDGLAALKAGSLMFCSIVGAVLLSLKVIPSGA